MYQSNRYDQCLPSYNILKIKWFFQKKKNWFLSLFWGFEEHILYETLLEKWVFWLKWGVNQVRTLSSSGDMDFYHLCLNFLHNSPNRAQNHPTHQYFFWEQIKLPREHPRGPRTTITILPLSWARWTPNGTWTGTTFELKAAYFFL